MKYPPPVLQTYCALTLAKQLDGSHGSTAAKSILSLQYTPGTTTDAELEVQGYGLSVGFAPEYVIKAASVVKAVPGLVQQEQDPVSRS